MRCFCLAASLLLLPGLASAAPAASGGSVPPGFVPAGNELEVVEDPRTGREVRFLTSGEHTDATFYATQNTWSTDGRYVFFESDRPGPESGSGGHERDWQLMAADVGSGELYHIAPIPFLPGRGTGALEFHANLHPDLEVLYIVDLSGTRIYTHRLETGVTELVRTLPEGTIAKMPPSFSADGGQVALAVAWPRPGGADETHNGWEYAVQVLDILDGDGRLGEPRTVATQVGLKKTADSPGATISHQQFNPTDNTLLAYKVAEDLYTVRSDGSELEHRYGYTGPGWRGHQSWSADGTRMNFIDNGDIGFYLLADRSTGFYQRDMEPEAWHQDGNEGPLMVYDHRDADSDWDQHDNRTGSIAVLHKQSGRTATLCETVFSKKHPRHPHPQFSPNGREVAFNRSHEERCRVAVVAAPEPGELAD